jgi:phosphohistidine phosphatase
VILYFLRHGKAGSPRPTNDDARELTKNGVSALRDAAPLWRRLNLRPDVVLSSPLARAFQTAELFCEAVGGKPVADDRLRPGASWAEMAQALADLPDARRVMFVGHEPDLS